MKNEEITGKCPICGGNVVETEWFYTCETKNCLIIHKSIGGKEVTKKQAIKLLTKGRTCKLKNFSDNEGGVIDAVIKLEGKRIVLTSCTPSKRYKRYSDMFDLEHFSIEKFFQKIFEEGDKS